VKLSSVGFGIKFRRQTDGENRAAFPLILTFSPGEKEQSLADFIKRGRLPAVFSRGFAKALGAFLPLPWGEGWGEGERDALSTLLKTRPKRFLVFRVISCVSWFAKINHPRSPRPGATSASRT